MTEMLHQLSCLPPDKNGHLFEVVFVDLVQQKREQQILAADRRHQGLPLAASFASATTNNHGPYLLCFCDPFLSHQTGLSELSVQLLAEKFGHRCPICGILNLQLFEYGRELHFDVVEAECLSRFEHRLHTHEVGGPIRSRLDSFPGKPLSIELVEFFLRNLDVGSLSRSSVLVASLRSS